MARRRKVVYPPPKTATKSASAAAASDARTPIQRAVSIDTSAIAGRGSLQRGDRVRILAGLYVGEIAVVESVVGGVIPAVQIRTDAGMTRRVRTIDLAPASAPAPPGPDPATGAAPPPDDVPAEAPSSAMNPGNGERGPA